MLESKVVNKIGLEGEFFLLDKKDNLVFPVNYGFETDDFCLLGEFRCKPGNTYNEVIGNYFNELALIYKRAEENKLRIKYNYCVIPIELKKKILKLMGTKEISDTKNIYGKSILEYSDDIIEDGKIISTVVSAGLHIHFSKEVLASYKDKDNISVESKTYVLSQKDKVSIIRYMDNKVYPLYPVDITPYKQFKYRMKGYYEDKSYGFEYRSLPMLEEFTDFKTISKLVENCFTAFNLI